MKLKQKEIKILNEIKKENIQLYDYQKKALDESNPNFIYTLDTGLGKTFLSLAHKDKYYPKEKLLIITPKSKIEKLEWHKDLIKWYGNVNFDNVEITTDDKIRNLLANCKNKQDVEKIFDIKNTFIIYDEAHRMKGDIKQKGGSSRAKSMYNLLSATNKFILLTATPASNQLKEVRNYLMLFKEADMDKMSFTAFNKKFCEIETIYKKNETINTYGGIKLLYANLLEQLFKKHCSSYVDKMELITNINPNFKLNNEVIYVPSSDLYNQLYDALVEHNLKSFRNLPSEILDSIETDGVSPMKIAHLLMQNANPEEKVKKAIEIANNHKNTVIFTKYKNDVKNLVDSMVDKNEYKVFQITGDIKDYDEEKLDKDRKNIVIANYSSGGTGINLLDFEASVFFTPTDSYQNYHQAKGRNIRITTEMDNIHHFSIVANNTIDVDVFRLLNKKGISHKQLLEGIRKVVKGNTNKNYIKTHTNKLYQRTFDIEKEKYILKPNFNDMLKILDVYAKTPLFILVASEYGLEKINGDEMVNILNEDILTYMVSIQYNDKDTVEEKLGVEIVPANIEVDLTEFRIPSLKDKQLYQSKIIKLFASNEYVEKLDEKGITKRVVEYKQKIEEYKNKDFNDIESNNNIDNEYE